MAGDAAYLRVSSRAQDHKTQRRAIERMAAARGFEIAEDKWYHEKRTGKTLARPELDRLRADARAGHVRRLVVFRLDRLTRSGIRDTFELVEELRGHGVEIVSVADGFDLAGPAAEVVLAVMAWAAKMERLAINERIAAARERLSQEGKPWGRPPRLAPADRARASELRRQGRSLREIAVALKVPRSTIARALSRKDGAAEAPTDGGNPGDLDGKRGPSR
jgi:site-specific DNA recombinase